MFRSASQSSPGPIQGFRVTIRSAGGFLFRIPIHRTSPPGSALDRGEFTDIHDVDPEYSPDLTEYDVWLTDITNEELESKIAEELSIPYFSKATEADTKEVVQVAEGYIYGLHKRIIVPFVVNKKEACWGFFSSWLRGHMV